MSKHLFGMAARVTCDARGLCLESYSPVGGITIPVAVGAMAAWLLTPRKVQMRGPEQEGAD